MLCAFSHHFGKFGLLVSISEKLKTIYRRLWKVSVNDFENKFRLLLYQKISHEPNPIDETIYLNLWQTSSQKKKTFENRSFAPFLFYSREFCISTKLFEPKQLADQWFIIQFVLFFIAFSLLSVSVSVSFVFVCTNTLRETDD